MRNGAIGSDGDGGTEVQMKTTTPRRVPTAAHAGIPAPHAAPQVVTATDKTNPQNRRLHHRPPVPTLTQTLPSIGSWITDGRKNKRDFAKKLSRTHPTNQATKELEARRKGPEMQHKHQTKAKTANLGARRGKFQKRTMQPQHVVYPTKAM